MTQFPIKRSELPPGESLCSYCTAMCCRYFSLPIDKPETWEEFDTVRWFMYHGKVSIYVDDDTWYICIYADCRHLQPDNSCGVYEDRPQICRDYSTSDCEYDDDGVHDLLFETPEQLWDYAEKILPPRDRQPGHKQNGRASKRGKKKSKATNGSSQNGRLGVQFGLPIIQEQASCLARRAGTPAQAQGTPRPRSRRP